MPRYGTLEELSKAFKMGQFGMDGQHIRVEDDDKDKELVRVSCAEESEDTFEVMFEGRVKGGYKAVVKAFGPSFETAEG